MTDRRDPERPAVPVGTEQDVTFVGAVVREQTTGDAPEHAREARAIVEANGIGNARYRISTLRQQSATFGYSQSQ